MMFRLIVAALAAGLSVNAGLLLAADAKKNTAAESAPKMTKDGKPEPGFVKRHEGFLEITKKGDIGVVFLGDSITDGWRGGGKAVWEKSFGPLKPANFGIGGDRTQHVLWRIANGELDGLTPKAAVIMIGTNNLGGNTAEEIAAGITAIVKAVHAKHAATKILLLAVFPRGDDPAKPNVKASREKIKTINDIIAKLDDGKTVRFLDIGPKFLEADGKISKEIMPDYLHLSAKGYGIWADAITPLLSELTK